MKRLEKVKKTLMIGPQIIGFIMKEILDLLKECRSPDWELIEHQINDEAA